MEFLEKKVEEENLYDLVINRTNTFYTEVDIQKASEEKIYSSNYQKSLDALAQTLDMFNRLNIAYKLENIKGRLSLVAKVLEVREELKDNNLYLTILSDVKLSEDKVFFTSGLNVEGSSYMKQQVFTTEKDLVLNFSSSILEITKNTQGFRFEIILICFFQINVNIKI